MACLFGGFSDRWMDWMKVHVRVPEVWQKVHGTWSVQSLMYFIILYSFHAHRIGWMQRPFSFVKRKYVYINHGYMWLKEMAWLKNKKRPHLMMTHDTGKMLNSDPPCSLNFYKMSFSFLSRTSISSSACWGSVEPFLTTQLKFSRSCHCTG